MTSKKKSKLLKFILAVVITLNFIVLGVFGFLLYGSVRAYFYGPDKNFKKINRYANILARKTKKVVNNPSLIKKTFKRTLLIASKKHKTPTKKNLKIKKDTPKVIAKTAKETTHNSIEHNKPEAETDKNNIQKTNTIKTDKKPIEKKQEKPKAKPVTITYKNLKAKKVELIGTFSSWNSIKMKKEKGIWKTVIYLFSGKYKYNFLVDGRQMPDPLALLKSENSSVLVVD